MATNPLSIDTLWRWGTQLTPPMRGLLSQAVLTTYDYASTLAWAKLRDQDQADVLMDLALESIVPYVARCTPLPDQRKVTDRLRSQIRRVANQHAYKTRAEEPRGLLCDLVDLSADNTPDYSDALLVGQICAGLTPRARIVAEARRQGYTWREIARSLDVAESAVRQSFRKEVDAALLKRGKGTLRESSRDLVL